MLGCGLRWPGRRRRHGRRRGATAMVGVGATARERRNGERGTGQELTVDSTASSESSGTHWRRWGREDDLRRPEMRTTAMEALQGLPRRVARRRGRRRRGGACRHGERARGRRWIWPRRAAATVALGHSRGRATEAGRRTGESERGLGVTWRRSRRPGRRGRGQAGRWRGAHADGHCRHTAEPSSRLTRHGSSIATKGVFVVGVGFYV